MDKLRKNQLSLEQLQSDYNIEKSSVVKLEGYRSMLERQNKELKAKLAEMESEVRSKSKATIASLESKVSSSVSLLKLISRNNSASRCLTTQKNGSTLRCFTIQKNGSTLGCPTIQINGTPKIL